MNIKELLHSKLKKIYLSCNPMIETVGGYIAPETEKIVAIFYDELSAMKEPALILNKDIVRKNLPPALEKWLHTIFRSHREEEIDALLRRQSQIGAIHANINVNINYFQHGITILKREIYNIIRTKIADRDEMSEMYLVVDEIFDILLSIISESYFSNELIHENNELSLKFKGLTQNTAIECERLRAMLLDWYRTALMYLFLSPDINMSSLPKLQYSNFGLWVVYKSDFLAHTLDLSSELKKHVQEVDDAFLNAASFRREGDENKFSAAVRDLDEIITRASWFIASIVDQAIELDTGRDPLTRLFNRRYLITILRRLTHINLNQGFPFGVLMLDIDFFKKVNDEYGHDAGDSVLKQFSELLLISVRASDFIFRYGGEEFLIILGNVRERDAESIAEKIRSGCEQYAFALPGGQTIGVTCSIGIAIHDGHPDYNRVIKNADNAVYTAKQSGRNRVVIST